MLRSRWAILRSALFGPALTVTVLGGTLAGAVAAPASAEEIELQLSATGALHTDSHVSHVVDGGHFCSAAADPWSDPAATDHRATPFPFYRVVFGQASPEDEPDMPGPSLGLALSNYFTAARDHSDPINDSIELVIDGRHFVGHSGLDDPGYRFAVSFREDRHGGGFVARHLHEAGTGSGVLDVAGNWQCAPVSADMPEVSVRAHKLFAGAQPAKREATHLRLWRGDLPCAPAGCGDWRVIDQATGEAFMATVNLKRLHLARALRRSAEAGSVELLVDADIRPGDPPCVVPRLLAGVQPGPRPVATAEIRPATALR